MTQMGKIVVTAKNVPAARVYRHAATPVAMMYVVAQLSLVATIVVAATFVAIMFAAMQVKLAVTALAATLLTVVTTIYVAIQAKSVVQIQVFIAADLVKAAAKDLVTIRKHKDVVTGQYTTCQHTDVVTAKLFIIKQQKNAVMKEQVIPARRARWTKNVATAIAANRTSVVIMAFV